MLKEYAVVRLMKADPTIPLPLHTRGTVLMVLSSNPPVYEVEFIDAGGKSLGTFTVEEANLEEEEK